MLSDHRRNALERIVRAVIPDSFRPSQYMARKAFAITGGTVRGGPFRGMKYVDESICSSYVPKLLGIYERELAPVIDRLCGRRWSHIIDIGAAEGYYAVGMAMRCRPPCTTAFEADERGRKLLSRMARLNGLDAAITIRGWCGPRDLDECLGRADGDSLLICDCEGAEMELLDPGRNPRLVECHILVEVHDFVHEGIGRELVRRFSPSHVVERIDDGERNANDYPFRDFYIRLIPGRFRLAAVDEWRPARMYWLYIKPRDR